MKIHRNFLKITRFFLSLVFFIVYTFLFFAGYGKITNLLGSIQFIPAILSVRNGQLFLVFALAVIILLTLTTGRFYCAFLCPAGSLQEFLLLFRRKNFRYRKKNKYFLLFSIGIFIFSLFGFSILLRFFDPFGIFGKFVVLIIKPVAIFIYNTVGWVLSGLKIYSGYYSLYGISIFALFYIAGFLIICLILARSHGRLYCNYLCPIGTILGIFSAVSLLKLKISDSCIKCGRCEKVCPALCIDYKNGEIDFSRCLLCGNCISICPCNSIKFEASYKKFFTSRNEFFMLSGNFFSLSLFLPFLKSESKGIAHKIFYPFPPGGISFEHLASNCVSCFLCVSNCPTRVIKPSFKEYGLDILLPVMDYSRSYCSYDCILCGEICPTGAIKPLSLDEKHLVKMGEAKLIKSQCIVYKFEKSCGACAEICPTTAVHMISYKNGLTAPEVSPEFCIGCGACEYACPALPKKAIYVEGMKIHTRVKKPERSIDKKEGLEEFPF